MTTTISRVFSLIFSFVDVADLDWWLTSNSKSSFASECEKEAQDPDLATTVGASLCPCYGTATDFRIRGLLLLISFEVHAGR